MRKFIVTCVFLVLVFATAYGQHRPTNYARSYAEYGYNYTWGHYGSIGAIADMRVAKNFSIEGGFMLSTANVYAIDARLAYQIPLENCAFYFESRALCRWFARNDTQEYTFALSAGFVNYHWKFLFGTYGRLSGAMPSWWGYGEKRFFEPWGIMYLGEGKVFRDDHSWNIGGRISNVNYFMIERVTMPLFTLFGDARVGEKLKIFAEVTAHPSGTFNIQAQFYGIMGQVGIKYNL